MTSKIFKLSVMICLFLIVSGCSSDDSPQVQRTTSDVEEDFQALDLSVGVNDVTINNTNGEPWYFRVIIPKSASSSKRPLVITLHGAAGGDPNAHKATACFTEPGFEAIDPIIISPNGGETLWYEQFNQDMVLSLTYLAIKYLPVDQDKVVITGYSNGGNGSWYYAETRPGFVSAAIPIASSYNTFNTSGNPRKIDTPLYVIHGENDEVFPLEQTKEWIEATEDAGTNVTFEVAPGLTHNQPCEYVPYLKHAATWLQTEVWN